MGDRGSCADARGGIEAVLIELSSDALVTLAADGRVRSWNPSAARLFGVPAERALGGMLVELVPALAGAGVPSGAIEGLDLQHGLVVTHRRADAAVPVAISWRALRDATGALAGVAVSAHPAPVHPAPVHPAPVHPADRLKTEFLANLSHELRTPLNAIIGFATLIHDGKVGWVSPTHKEYLGDVLAAARQLLQLINDVLDLARVESGRIELRPERIELARVFEEARAVLRGRAFEKRVEVGVEVHPDVTFVTLDPARLKQLVYIHLANAIAFTPRGGAVRVRFTPEAGDRLRMEVEDSGEGIPAAELAHVFDELRRPGTGARAHGSGLGLALARRVTEALGGTVEVRSTVGQGTTFTTLLPRGVPVLATAPPVSAPPLPAPARPAPPLPAPPLPAPPLSGEHGRAAILVVDADPAAAGLLEAPLARLGLRTISTQPGADALVAIQAVRPAAIVVDPPLAAIGGFEILERLRGLLPGVPIVAWTDEALTRARRGRLDASVQAVVRKGDGADALLAVLGPLLGPLPDPASRP